MLAKTGDTATYIQYSYARIGGIFRKGGIDREVFCRQAHRVFLNHPSERKLAMHLLRFQEIIEAVAGDCRPNLLTQHLFETADRFTSFYENCTVLKEENEELRNSRLVLCGLTARTLRQGLALLGIGTCEQM
jgi:arginyl-tRNA synthetase